MTLGDSSVDRATARVVHQRRGARPLVNALAGPQLPANRPEPSKDLKIGTACYGSGREGVELAQAAARSARSFASPEIVSRLAAREALGHARAGDATAAERMLARSEHLLDRAEPGALGGTWLSHLAWDHSSLANTTAAHLMLGAPPRRPEPGTGRRRPVPGGPPPLEKRNSTASSQQRSSPTAPGRGGSRRRRHAGPSRRDLVAKHSC